MVDVKGGRDDSQLPAFEKQAVTQSEVTQRNELCQKKGYISNKPRGPGRKPSIASKTYFISNTESDLTTLFLHTTQECKHNMVTWQERFNLTGFPKGPTSHPPHHTVRICQVIPSNLFLIQQLPLHRERSTRHMWTAVHHEFQPNIHMHLHMRLQSPTCNWISLTMGHLCLEKQKWSFFLSFYTILKS